MGTTIDALPPRMVRTYSGFWLWRVLHRRRSLRACRPPAGQEGFRTGKPDSLECQTGPFDFLGDNDGSWLPARVRGAEEQIFYWSIREQAGEDRAEERIFGQ
jgi:hypothetical protein